MCKVQTNSGYGRLDVVQMLACALHPAWTQTPGKAQTVHKTSIQPEIKVNQALTDDFAFQRISLKADLARALDPKLSRMACLLLTFTTWGQRTARLRQCKVSWCYMWLYWYVAICSRGFIFDIDGALAWFGLLRITNVRDHTKPFQLPPRYKNQQDSCNLGTHDALIPQG